MDKLRKAIIKGKLIIEKNEVGFLRKVKKDLCVPIMMMDCSLGIQLHVELFINKEVLTPFVKELFENQLSPPQYNLAYSYVYSDIPKDELAILSRNIWDIFSDCFHIYFNKFSDC